MNLGDWGNGEKEWGVADKKKKKRGGRQAI